MNDTIGRIALLVKAGILVRHDGPYERHYPDRRDRFLARIEAALRLGEIK